MNWDFWNYWIPRWTLCLLFGFALGVVVAALI